MVVLGWAELLSAHTLCCVGTCETYSDQVHEPKGACDWRVYGIVKSDVRLTSKRALYMKAYRTTCAQVANTLVGPHHGRAGRTQQQAVCLRCGRAGCDGAGVGDYVRAEGGCNSSYSKDDLSLTYCYVCHKRGHMCCRCVYTVCGAMLACPTWMFEASSCSVECSVVRNSTVKSAPPSIAVVGMRRGQVYGGWQDKELVKPRASTAVCRQAPSSIFKLSCYNCGNRGHAAEDCPKERPVGVRNERRSENGVRGGRDSCYDRDNMRYGGRICKLDSKRCRTRPVQRLEWHKCMGTSRHPLGMRQVCVLLPHGSAPP